VNLVSQTNDCLRELVICHFVLEIEHVNPVYFLTGRRGGFSLLSKLWQDAEDFRRVLYIPETCSLNQIAPWNAKYLQALNHCKAVH